MQEVIARANANIALVQSWGRRTTCLNLPYTGCISLTLDGLSSTVRWANRADLDRDRLTIDEQPAAGAIAERLHAHVDHLRRAARRSTRCSVDVQTAGRLHLGLGAATATFAALTVAGSAALDLDLPPRELSILARLGTGSAARSVFGGFVEMQGGELADGSDCFAEPLPLPADWPLAVLVAEVRSEGSARCRSAHDLKASPFFPAWLEAHDEDLDGLREAIRQLDLTRLGEIIEHNCLKARAVALAALPAVISFAPATLAVIARVRDLRAQGIAAYFTVGAGPHVSVLCRPEDAAGVHAALVAVDGVRRVWRSGPGAAAAVVANR